MTTELGGSRDGEIGTHLRLLSGLLAERGWDVHVLLCGDLETEEAPEGVALHALDAFPAAPGAGLRHFGGDEPAVILGEQALEALELLHAEHRFDLVEFPDRGALGLRSIQAKAGGDALADVILAVKLHGPTRRRREANLELRSAPRELKLEFCERYGFERADVQLGSSQQMLDWAAAAEWAVRDDAAVASPAPGSQPEPAEQVAPIRDRAEAVYRRLVERPPQPARAAPSSKPPTVTVAVAHYNHEQFLPGALASLAAQTRPPEEVIVVDDGSTSAAARAAFDEQEKRYPGWTFVRQENTGPGAARNRCLERATGEYFLPFDSDNIAMPQLVEKLVVAMERNPGRAATTCHNLAFVEDADIEAGDFEFRYAPLGGPRVSACVENVYGDTCALFRTESLRAVGGFEGLRWSPHEDWETFLKLTMRGFEVEVLPRPLFYYRTDAGGRLQELTADPAVAFRHRARIIDAFLVDAELTRGERRDLWECLLAFDRFATEGLEGRLQEQRLWHDGQMADLQAFGRSELEKLRGQLVAAAEAERSRADAERSRAEAAEQELADLAALGPRRLLLRALNRVRSRRSRSAP